MDNRIRFVEIAKDIYAAITPATELDITDAGMMDNFSNSAYINCGETKCLKKLRLWGIRIC